MVEDLARLIIRLRYLSIAATLLIVAVLGSGVRFIEFTNDYRVFFGADNPQLAAFESLQDTYSKNDNVLIMLAPRHRQVFVPETLAAVIEVTDLSWQIPYSIRVDSISNFQHTSAQGDDLIVKDLISGLDKLRQDEIDALEEVALKEPRLLNRLISPDVEVTAVNVTVELPGRDRIHEVPQVVQHVRSMVKDLEARYPQIDFYVTGVVFMNNAFQEASKADMRFLLPLSFAVIVVGLLIFLRNFPGVLGTVVVILFSIVLALGTTGWLGISLTPPSATAPIMILTLAVADCVHFLTNFLQGMRKRLSTHDAIVESLRINLHPIFLTSLTTAIGFLSLNFSDSPPFQDLGNITAMGVVYAFFLSIFFLPALMAVLPVHVKAVDTRASRLMETVAQFVVTSRRALLWGLGSVAVGFIALVPMNELNDVFVEYFDPSIKFRRDTDMVTERLTGLYSIDYSVDSTSSGGISEPEFLHKTDAFARWLREQPEVLHVNVITDTFKRLNKNMHGDDPAFYSLPEERELAAQFLLLYEMSLPYGLDLNNQINVDKSSTRVSVSLETISTQQVLALEQRASAWFEAHAPDLRFQGASPAIMFSHIGARNIRSMLVGTSFALVLISFTLMFALRSFTLGLISLIPNLFPAGIAFGVWALLVGEIGLSLSVVAGMTLGIVVDDTVHFLSKYLRARREQGLSSEDAVRYAFATVGIALWVTTVVLVAGFLVLSLSAFELNAGMGLLTAITLAIALAIDFLLLPPLLMHFRGFGR